MPKKGTTARLSPPDKLVLAPPPQNTDATDPTSPKRQARSVHSGRTLPEILTDTTHADYRVRWKAADELSQLNEIEPLVRLLGDTSDVLRAFVARRLGEMQATRGVDMLIHVLTHDRDETVRRTAALALKHIGTPEARAALAHYKRQQQA
jgi:formate-dependent nitrite reductase cytochrome c552 subunit